MQTIYISMKAISAVSEKKLILRGGKFSNRVEGARAAALLRVALANTERVSSAHGQSG
jgi:hypothetical protein